jgi:4-diphosphocytidyl-2-C-methyl-D-erythritol kinase
LLASKSGEALEAFAAAKVNLTLGVVGRRRDDYHLLDSLVAFADVGDHLQLRPGESLGLTVNGAAQEIGAPQDNLVLRAAHSLMAQIPDLAAGHFILDKKLPVASGIGGGSADAAAALRLLAQVNGLSLDDPRLMQAACQTGADVLVCLTSKARVMQGVGDLLSAPVDLPPLPAVLVNPRVSVATRDVFAALGLQPTANAADQARGSPIAPRFTAQDELFDYVMARSNDLEAPAIRLHPLIGDVLSELRQLPGCRLARMSGSGATCFALFAQASEAEAAAHLIAGAHPAWWVVATHLG